MSLYYYSNNASRSAQVIVPNRFSVVRMSAKVAGIYCDESYIKLRQASLKRLVDSTTNIKDTKWVALQSLFVKRM